MDEARPTEKRGRTPNRLGYGAGYYGRTLATRVGKIELRVPQHRQGRFRTEVFARYQRSERAPVIAMAGFPAHHLHDSLPRCGPELVQICNGSPYKLGRIPRPSKGAQSLGERLYSENGVPGRVERLSGATRRDRTGDLLITNQPLYQLS